MLATMLLARALFPLILAFATFSAFGSPSSGNQSQSQFFSVPSNTNSLSAGSSSTLSWPVASSVPGNWNHMQPLSTPASGAILHNNVHLMTFPQLLQEASSIFAARPHNYEWVVGNLYDVDAFFDNHERAQLPAYRHLLLCILKRDFHQVLSVAAFGHVDFGRWLFNRKIGIFVTYFHLMAVLFSVDELEGLMTFFDERFLILPLSNGLNFMQMAINAQDNARVDYLRHFFLKYVKEVAELKDRLSGATDMDG